MLESRNHVRWNYSLAHIDIKMGDSSIVHRISQIVAIGFRRKLERKNRVRWNRLVMHSINMKHHSTEPHRIATHVKCYLTYSLTLSMFIANAMRKSLFSAI